MPFFWRLSLFYAALFIFYGVHVPFFPLWLDGRGLTAAEISFVTAAPFFLRLIVTPACALAADRRADHRGMIVLLAWVSLGAGLVLIPLVGFYAIAAIAVVYALATSTIMPLTETIAIRGAREHSLDYGRMRLWGSLAFIAAGAAGGLAIDLFGFEAALTLTIVGCAATVMAARFLPPSVRNLDDSSDAEVPRIHSADVKPLIRSPIFLVFLVAVATIQGAHAAFYTFGALHWQQQGVSGASISALWAIGVLAEVAVFAYSRAILNWIGPARLLLLGGAAAVLRWLAMGFDPPFAALAPLQIMHALSYGASHLGAVHFASRAVPEGASGTAQALYSTASSGIGLGVGTLIAGQIYATHGGGVYLGMASFAAIGVIAALVLDLRWDGGLLWGKTPATGEPRVQPQSAEFGG